MTDESILLMIRDMDPDYIFTSPPTNNDYINFHMSVIAEFGPKAWHDYNRPAKGQGTYE
jgi:hypothetical protein